MKFFYYIFFMTSSAGLGFLKFIVLSKILDPSDFGNYASLFGIATILSLVMSFGLIEETIKDYPRKWKLNEKNEILMDAKKVSLIISRRFFLCSSIFFLASFLLHLPFTAIEIFLVATVGLLTSLFSLMSSIIRAGESKKEIASFSFLRYFSVFCMAWIGCVYLGWKGAFFGDIAGSILVLLLKMHNLSKKSEKNKIRKTTPVFDPLRTLNGKYLFGSYILTAFTMNADKSLINLSLGPEASGSYAVIMIVPLIVQNLVNIFTQYLGPRIINKADKNYSKTVVSKTLFFITILSLLATVFLLLSKKLCFFDSYFSKYNIKNSEIILSGLISITYISNLLEFNFIARDREKSIWYCTAAFVFFFFGAFFCIYLFKLELFLCILTIFLCRLIYVFSLWYLHCKADRKLIF